MALIPSFFLDCVVAIGTINSSKDINWIATGFLYGYFQEKQDKGNLYYVYLVTNRHVFENKNNIIIRFNSLMNNTAQEYSLNLVDNGNKLWYSCSDIQKDVAVIMLNAKKLRADGIQFSYFQDDNNVAKLDKLIELGISEGDLAYLLGFPMGIIGGDKNYVIVRNGSIARIQDLLNKVSNNFLIDAFVFPGNSGGPVILKPEVISIEGTKPQNSSYLIGIVTSYVPYRDVAVSKQTQQPRVIFEENSGLASVQPIDFVHEAIQEHLKLLSTLNEKKIKGSLVDKTLSND
jgi:S1-C subfamily serine protease